MMTYSVLVPEPVYQVHDRFYNLTKVIITNNNTQTNKSP